MALPSGSQTVGPFFRFALERPWSALNVAPGAADAIVVTGVVRDGDGAPVSDALVEIRQARPDGSYRSDAAFPGFGRCATDASGTYRFTTVVSGAVPSPLGVQAPHLEVTIFARGLLKALATRLYFGDRETENADDPLLRTLAPPVRATLLAARADEGATPAYRFDIVLQGEGETAFFAP